MVFALVIGCDQYAITSAGIMPEFGAHLGAFGRIWANAIRPYRQATKQKPQKKPGFSIAQSNTNLI